MTETMEFRRGAEEAKAASKFASFARTNFFGIEDDEVAIVRFLTDAQGDNAWIVVDQHQMIPTKGKPADSKAEKWPEKMGCVCRNTKMAGGQPMYGDCYICEFMVGKLQIGKEKLKKPSARSWALACLREEVIENGQRVGLRDKTREVERKKQGSEETETVIEKAIVVVNMGYKNFFSILEGFYGYFGGTILDQDFWIKRSGKTANDTTYQIVPMGAVPHKDGTTLDVRKPEHMARYGFADQTEAYDALKNIVLDRASERVYALYFDPRVTVSAEDTNGQVTTTGASPAPAVNNDVENKADLDALAERVKNYGVAEPAPAPAPETPPAPAPTAPPPSEPQQPPTPPPAPVGVGGMKDFD